MNQSDLDRLLLAHLLYGFHTTTESITSVFWESGGFNFR